MLYYLVTNRGNIDFLKLIFIFLSYAMIILVALPIHEFAHAYTAYKMGDSTAKWNGRLTLNPFAHLDIFGTILIFIAGFGYAKPVPINPRNFRDYKAGIMLTSFAGPLSNFLMCILTLVIWRVLYFIAPLSIIVYYLGILFEQFALINVMLAIFNLLPIPPLDGYNIISNFLPSRWLYFIQRYQWYFTIALFALIATGRFLPIGTWATNITLLLMKILGFF